MGYLTAIPKVMRLVCGCGVETRWEVTTHAVEVKCECGAVWTVAPKPAGAYRGAYYPDHWERDTRWGAALPHTGD